MTAGPGGRYRADIPRFGTHLQSTFLLVWARSAAGQSCVRQARMLTAYRTQDWDGAEAALEALHGPFGLDSVAKLYAGRIAAYRKSPPGKDWDGVFEATEK